MLPIPTRIKAIAEDPTSPDLTCYDATDIESLAALAVSKIFATNPTTTKPTKETKSMSYNSINPANPDYVTSEAPKRFVNGVMANDNPQALIKTLHKLGLVGNDIVDPLVQIAAAGKPLGHLFQVSLYDVDRALKGVANADPQARIGFKASLRNAGLLKS
jgi:hypothetical protein